MDSPIDYSLDLGTGIYTIPDVAVILRLPQQKVRRWLNEYWNERFSKSVKEKFSIGEGKEKVTNFYTLIEFFTFYQLREFGVTTKKIIHAHDILADQLKVNYPFATSNILTDGKSVLFMELGNIIKADNSLQVVIKEVIEPFCHKIDFNSSQLAERFFPLGKGHEVIIDPNRQFGQPVVSHTNILTETIFMLYKGGEPVSLISDLYDLSEKQVKDAINFYIQAA